MQVLAWLVRPCGFDACPSCVSSSLVHAAPWLAGPREAEGASGRRSRPRFTRHHVGNRACVAARPGRRHPSQPPHLLRGISWGCLRVVDGNAGTVSSFPARTTVARHDRFCLQVLAWLVRPCGFDACPSCVSSSLVHAAPWLAGPREAEGASGPAKPA